MSKKPKKFPASTLKNIKTAEQQSQGKHYVNAGTLQAPIAWNFKDVEWQHPDFHCTYRDFLERSKQIIDNFEGKTFAQIERDSKHSHGWETQKLAKDFQNLLKAKGLEQAVVYQLHITGKCRLFGYITDGNIFHVVAFDNEHKAYPVSKKHT